jgi:hypothetical protein
LPLTSGVRLFASPVVHAVISFIVPRFDNGAKFRRISHLETVLMRTQI